MTAYGAIEIRAAHDLRVSDSGRLEGYAAVFNHESQDLGGFTESVRPGAFARSLGDPASILALYDHDRKNVLGRVGAGTLRLMEDARGLSFSIDLPPTTTGRDLGALVERGDVQGASFAFTVPKGGDSWVRRGNKFHRELLDVNLHEITITASPAYLDTSVAKRMLPHIIFPVRLSLAQKFLETI